MNKRAMRRLYIVLAGAGFIGLLAFSNPGERYFEITKNLDIFATLFKEVNAYYVDEVNPNLLMKTGIESMLASLDPYTNYIPEDDIEDYRTMTTGEYGGIGAVIGNINGKNVIILPYKDFPANKSGLMIGDEIINIDGVDVTQKSTSEISQLLKGQANTPLEVTVQRYMHTEPLSFTLTREKITIDNVPFYGMVDHNTGYIKLSDFTTGAGKEVKKALDALKKQGAEKIVLDLRDNPGGLLNEAVNVANIFVSQGSEIVSTKGKVTDWNKTYRALNNPADIDIPLAVLTSRRSASASEIVAGVIQDYDRGILVGEKTFGKGLVQATRPLTYNSQLKITTAKYYIPSGRCIQSINYSERNENGGARHIPDSLKVAFRTKNGRMVYDGGGVDPDLAVEARDFTPITQSLIARGLIFTYAVKYRHDHPEVAPLEHFSISDADYDEFVAWLADKDYDYTTRVEKTIETLKAMAVKEKYFDKIEDAIESLSSEVQHNKEQDLQEFRAEIMNQLNIRIAEQYYLSEGSYSTSLKEDVQLQEAIRALNNREDYNKILARASSGL